MHTRAVTDTCPRCGAENPGGRFLACPFCLLEPDLSPDVLGGTYDLLERIGQGGMGTVYRARHRRLDRIVALKFITEPLAAGPEFHERLEMEGRTMARLEHPHIVKVHDLGREGGHSYIVMEHVDARPLSEQVPMRLAQVLDVADQVCDALAYAHRRGVVHCDVKPANILVDARGQVKITDFGIAHLRGPEPLAAAVSGRPLMGTLAYMAPEALEGAPADPRMDVYSLGVVLAEMATGRRPVPGEPLEGSLSRIVAKACNPDPAARYVDISDMRRELARLAESGAMHAAGPREASFIRMAALALGLASAVGLRAALDGAARALSAEPPAAGTLPLPTESLAVFAGSVAVLLGALGVLARRWPRDPSRPAPVDYEPAGARRVVPWGLVTLAAFALERFAGGRGASGLAGLAVPLLQLGALFWVWTAVLDAYRVGQSPARSSRVLLGAALAVSPSVIGLLLSLGR